VKSKKNGYWWRIRAFGHLEKFLHSKVSIQFGVGAIVVKFKDAEHFQKISSQLAGLQPINESPNEPNQSHNVLPGPQLREKIQERLATKITGNSDNQDGTGIIQIHFNGSDELERIYRTILGKPPLDEVFQYGKYEFPRPDLDEPQMQKQWLSKLFIPYSNPWWTDPRDFIQDQMTRNTAQLWFQGHCVRHLRRRKRRYQAIFFSPLLIIAYLKFTSWLGGISDSGTSYTEPIALWGSPLLLIALLLFTGRFRRKWANEAPFAEFQSAKKKLYKRSEDDYRDWRSSLRAIDPDLYFQILSWEQKEEMIRQNNEMIRQNQEILRLQQIATAAAQTNAQNTTAIRNQIRYGRE
jgi:hypothetical protein